MKIEKLKRKARVRGRDAWKLDAYFFLRRLAESHSGRELIQDILNSNTIFISLEDVYTQEILFINKTQIMCVDLEGRDLQEATLLSPLTPVMVTLLNGENLLGSFFVEMRPERSRISDFLNFTPQFLYLCRDEGDIIINKSYIFYVQEFITI